MKKQNEFIRLIIDVVWEATDGGTKLDISQFSHEEEPMGSLQELAKYVITVKDIDDLLP